MYFVRSWKVGLLTINIAIWLSQCIGIGVSTVKPSSDRSDPHQLAGGLCHRPVFCLCTGSVCFLLRQVTKFPLTYVQNLDVDFLFPLSPAYPESEYASIFWWSCFLYVNPFPGAPFTYARIRSVPSQWTFLGSCMNWLRKLTVYEIWNIWSCHCQIYEFTN